MADFMAGVMVTGILIALYKLFGFELSVICCFRNRYKKFI